MADSVKYQNNQLIDKKMENKKVNLRFGIICAVILLAAVSRLIPHPAGFAPIAGMALFGAAYYSKRYWAYLIPIASMWISDVILNNVMFSTYSNLYVWIYSGIFTYGAFALIVLLGTFALKKVRILNLTLSAVGASVIFYAVSNFGVWLSSAAYPHTLTGLQACYIAALPFFRNAMTGDLVYTAALFGVFELLQYKFRALQLQKAIH
ncbi:MAG: hypothetical protein LBT50_02460 [Prevotellaceae bacterium]|jgi:hypothetical protein|nr:hypothetical protein [Prevotellaceae bacterium]